MSHVVSRPSFLAAAGKRLAVSLAMTAVVGWSLAVSRRYEVDNLPMTLLIDRNGIVRYVLRDYSAKSDDLYLQQLRTLLNE